MRINTPHQGGLAFGLLGILWLGTAMTMSASARAGDLAEWRDKMRPITPKEYLCRYSAQPPQIDGRLDDPPWASAPWTDDFVDIQGASLPTPRFRTRVKLLWDEDYLYIAAELEEPHVWATLTRHDAVIFQDPDFEVFIDPDGDAHNYYEFEINALGTGWDLRLDKPYLDQGKPHNEWEIPGLKSAVQVGGTLNNPSDIDTGWTVELAFPWKVLGKYARHAGPPTPGEQWRINFSRVEWQVTTNGGRYHKVPGVPEDNWVWSPQGVVDMHRPEMWGVLQFAGRAVSGNSVLAPLAAKPARDVALDIYYAQRDFWKAHNRWATNLAELGWETKELPPGVEAPVLGPTADGYVCAVASGQGESRHVWRVRQDRMLKLDEPIPVGNEHEISKEYVPPKDPLVRQKLEWWQDLKFGLLMHWGTYSQWGIVESWSICPEDEGWCRRKGPWASNYCEYVTAYENLRRTFNPVKFNPEKWAVAAKNAGMRYVVFTTKHHDGFCMFDTAQTDYRVTSPDCPFHTNQLANITKAVFAAFRHEGFGIGAYFSKPDWHSPYYWWPYFPPKDRNPNYDLARYPDRWRQFKQFTWRQIEELMTGYGRVDILWLDGGWVRPPQQDLDMNGLAAMARKHQPGLLVVDRTVRGENENYCTPENQVPHHWLPYPWETCMPMATSWSYVPHDRYKSPGTIVRDLCRVVARGGCLLLNIGPSPEGDFDPDAYDRLAKVGEWMKINGEAIYETRPTEPYEHGNWVFTRRRGGGTYAILLAKDDHETLPEQVTIPAEVAEGSVGVRLLGYGELKPGEAAGGRPTWSIPAEARKTLPAGCAWAFKLDKPGS